MSPNLYFPDDVEARTASQIATILALAAADDEPLSPIHHLCITMIRAQMLSYPGTSWQNVMDLLCEQFPPDDPILCLAENAGLLNSNN